MPKSGAPGRGASNAIAFHRAKRGGWTIVRGEKVIGTIEYSKAERKWHLFSGGNLFDRYDKAVDARAYVKRNWR